MRRDGMNFKKATHLYSRYFSAKLDRELLDDPRYEEMTDEELDKQYGSFRVPISALSCYRKAEEGEDSEHFYIKGKYYYDMVYSPDLRKTAKCVSKLLVFSRTNFCWGKARVRNQEAEFKIDGEIIKVSKYWTTTNYWFEGGAVYTCTRRSPFKPKTRK